MSQPFYITRTQEERRENYKLLKQAGFNCYVAQRLRDWRNRKVREFIILNTPDFFNKIHSQKPKGGTIKENA